MEIQMGCSDPPPCDPQPSGKINKAAFKLFGKRRSGGSGGGGMPSIFSVRNKGDATDKELIRSKTHDGLTATDELSESEGSGKEESASSDRLNAATTACSAITKSFSFFSLLRRNSSRISDRAATLGQRGRGLKGLFNSMRWRRKPPSRDASVEIHDIVKGAKGVDLILSCSSKHLEVESVTHTLEPQIQILQDNDATWENPPVQEDAVSSCSAVQPVAEEFPAASPVQVQTQEVLREKHGSPAHQASMTPRQERSSMDPPSEDRLSSMFNDVTSLKSFDSLTGCGDIIADPEEDSGNGGSVTSSGTGSSNGGLQVSAERCSPAKPPLPPQVVGLISMSAYAPARHRICPPTKTPQGSGIVAYMGGGEEMASPDGVDDADMQGLWHMLPQKGEDSPALPHLPSWQDKRPPQVKSLGLSKIPVGGSVRAGKQQHHHQQQLTRPSPPPIVKDLQDVPPSDEGYWDSPTPGPEDEDSGFLKRDGLLRDSCSGDALYDLYDLDSPGTVGSDDDSTSSPTPSTGDLKMTPPSRKPSCSSFRSIKGSTSLPRESKIPISVRQKPTSHSSSQGALSSPVSPTATDPSDCSSKADTPPRTRIPVSKVPVRSSGNKSAKAAPNRK